MTTNRHASDRLGPSVTALIPAAGGIIDPGLASVGGSSPTMIPVAGRPLIQWTMSYLLAQGVHDFRIAVPRRGLFVEEFVDCVFGTETRTRFIVPSSDRGVGLTIKELADAAPDGPALVVLGDTHFEFTDASALGGTEPVVLVDEVEESYRWCVAEIDDEGYIDRLRDKEVGVQGPLLALIGVYYFPDVGLLREAAQSAIDEVEGVVQIADILGRVAATTPIRAEIAAKWLDCGNPDRQAIAQRVLLQERAFNELQVDATFGTITKRSHHTEKFIDEINYLRLLPPDLAILFPRVVDQSTESDQPFLTLEFYGYPTLAELFVFGNLDPGIWHRIFGHLHRIITKGFMAHPFTVEPEAARAMYLGKVRDRSRSLTGPLELLRLVETTDPITINGESLAPIAELWPHLEDAVGKLEHRTLGSIIHGDLCFSNVLYDVRSGVCKLIDPRGSFGRAGLHGDARYDIAKLWHSVHGGYDFITADLFRAEVDGHDARLDILHRPYHNQIRREFEATFFSTFDRHEIDLVTGLLFASLPALHYDHPNRQIAMHLRAVQLLNHALDR